MINQPESADQTPIFLPGLSLVDAQVTTRSFQRMRILNAFVRRVGNHGLSDTQIMDVCKEASVSAKVFYSIFSSKVDCYEVAFSTGADFTYDVGRAAFNSHGGDPLERLLAAVHSILTVLADFPDFARLSIVEPIFAGPSGAACLEDIICQCQMAYGQGLTAASSPIFPVTACRSAVVGSSIYLLRELIRDGRATELPKLAPVIIHTVGLFYREARRGDGSAAS
ncbi:MAG TPA: TetR/AcrR family transcriptional regulator [Acidimicrobiales bacterium]|jgi:AcrR family transcriptional regulator|nr:TetR/AcrR family transcriptional regulator [Acidimicrobiales bacterium]